MSGILFLLRLSFALPIWFLFEFRRIQKDAEKAVDEATAELQKQLQATQQELAKAMGGIEYMTL